MKVTKWIIRFIIIVFIWSIIQVLFYKFIPVYFTPLMVIRSCEHMMNHEIPRWHHQWVPKEKIASSLKRAVIASEDNRFATHSGFDFEQIQKAIDEKKQRPQKKQRGASTISQQTAKNIFLWNGGGLFRKGLEAYYTVLIELFWSKERILEVYLNSIEMGDGIYGAEAAAKKYFHKSALRLSANESALIASTLPNPIRFNAAQPSAYMRRRQGQILNLMYKIPESPELFK